MIIANQKERGVLIVDDDAVRRALSARLEHDGFQNVFRAEDGLRALTCLELQGPNIYVIVTDIVMPGMDGVKLAEHLTANYSHPTGIIYITGYQKRKKEFKIGDFSETDILNFDIFMKPFDYSELIHRILQCGDLVFNRRISMSRYSIEQLSERLDSLSSTVVNIAEGQTAIQTRLGNLDKSLTEDVGREVIKAIIIALFVVVAVLGLDAAKLTDLLR